MKLPFLAVVFILSTPLLSFAQHSIPLPANHANAQPVMAIAPPVCLEGKPDAHISGEIEDVLKFDLHLSGCARIITDSPKENARGIRPGEFDPLPWRGIGANMLLKSGYILDGEKMITEFRLYEIPSGKQLWSEIFSGKRKFVRKMAHAFIDETLRVITGEEGPFSSHIVYVSNRSGNKEIYLMDYDGYNVREITSNGSINLNPSFSPDGKEIIYTSYKKGNPDLYLRRIYSGKETVISSRRGLNITGAWAPRGERIAMAMSKDGNTQLYLINEKGKELARLTNDDAIDISPSWSPDGKRIAFVSDRDGTPQIYTMNSDGSDVRRLTASGKYNVAPSWSPKGDKILYCRMDGSGPAFQIYVIGADGKGDTRLTTEGRNVYPHWSPDGRFIIFNSNRDGSDAIYLMRSDGSSEIKLTRGKGGDSQPVWAPHP